MHGGTWGERRYSSYSFTTSALDGRERYRLYDAYLNDYSLIWIRVSSGSIVSDYGLDDRGSIPGGGKGFFLYPLCPDRLWGPPILLYNGYRGVLSPGVKARPGRDADHSPPSSAEVVNEYEL
jgi:hypothetical protein